MSAAYLYIFLQSNLLEIPFYYLIARERDQGFWRLVGVVTLMNSLTHPLVFFGFMNLKLTYLQNILLAESFAITAEALFFALILRQSSTRSWFAAIIANLASWQVAPILTYLVFR